MGVNGGEVDFEARIADIPVCDKGSVEFQERDEVLELLRHSKDGVVENISSRIDFPGSLVRDAPYAADRNVRDPHNGPLA